ncbi:MAG: FAD-dependent oxidoreductase, partial [Lachnospiraceae bacterium]|nr:FAD-dependent oxidoreductase [Lachnospiraceae bacterium]
MKVVIVGGVAGGATAAARIRRLDERAEIVVFERTNYVSYANCGLPYYIGEVITDKEELTLQTPESFWKRFQIKIKVRHEVEAINIENKTVAVKNLETGESFQESYDKLILSPGAKAIMPKGAYKKERVFSLRTVEDTYKIYDFVKEKQPKTAVIAGGGFIGIELAENLHELGIRVTMVQRSDHLLPAIDYDMASFLHTKLRSKGIELVLNSAVKEIKEDKDKIRVQAGNLLLEADMAIMALGVEPDSKLAKEAGL